MQILNHLGKFSISIQKVKNSSLFRDSFWAVFGNGFGNLLLLIAGIIIARFLGKDLYGAYGLAKSTMFQLAVFSSFGLGYTSTKFISEFISNNPTKVKSVGYSSLFIAIVFSLVVSLSILLFSKQFASFSRHEELESIFKVVSILIIFRSLSTVSAGILAGLKQFKILGKNNIISGMIMLLLSVPLTHFWGLSGSLFSLSLSQIVLAILNSVYAIHFLIIRPDQNQCNLSRQLIVFSFPVALQEFSYSIYIWISNLLMARYANLGELGIYSACSQWNAVVLMVPNLLYNVVLSYLSGLSTVEEHHKMLKKLILINFICALLPFLLVLVFSPLIGRFYGPEFVGMTKVLNILLFSTIFYSCTNVFYSYLLSMGHNWVLCITKFTRDIIIVVALYYVLTISGGIHAAQNFAIINVIIAAIFMSVLAVISFQIDKNSISRIKQYGRDK